MSTVIYAPNELPRYPSPLTVFLAGSIEMGRAVDWQKQVIDALSDINCIVLNPRRPDWDASWEQSIDNPQFREQVEWELDALNQANIIAFYFAPETMSPISLLEFGMFAPKEYGQEVIVCCPKGFWRKGNVDIVAGRFDVPVYLNLDSFIAAIRQRLL